CEVRVDGNRARDLAPIVGLGALLPGFVELLPRRPAGETRRVPQVDAGVDDAVLFRKRAGRPGLLADRISEDPQDPRIEPIRAHPLVHDGIVSQACGADKTASRAMITALGDAHTV